MENEIGKSSSGDGGKGSGGNRRKLWLFKKSWRWRWRWRFLRSAFKWKRHTLQLSLLDDLLFKVVSVLEAVVLVATLSFFFLCCGCHI